MNSERYHRQIILNGFGEKAQVCLSKAKVLVVGAGGLGCPALQYLAAAGVGQIGIVDDDTVALSNLHRQVLYSTEDIGKFKADIAVKRLNEMNPEIVLSSHVFKLTKNNVFEILKAYDFILDGTDNFESRYLINDVCTLFQKPLIFAAVSGYEGQLAIFNVFDHQNQATNYRDLFPIQPELGEIPNCAENGVLGVLPGIIGSLAAAELIKLITGIGRPLINQLLHYNLLNQEQYIIDISPAHDRFLPKNEQDILNMEYVDSYGLGYREIDALQMQELLKQESTIIIDVRERKEVPVLDKSMYTQIPMSEFSIFLKSDKMPYKNIILLCQHGIRSKAAAEMLHEKYGSTKKIYSLKGGIVKSRNHFRIL